MFLFMKKNNTLKANPNILIDRLKDSSRRKISLKIGKRLYLIMLILRRGFKNLP
jgi:hypothetical protein